MFATSSSSSTAVDTSPYDIPVLIVGAGPVGLALALMLSKCNISCKIIEKRRAPEYYARAVAIQSRTLEIIYQLGILEDVLSKGIPMKFGIDAYSDGKTLFKVELPPGETPFPGLVSLVQSETERILESGLNDLGIYVDHGVELKNLIFDDKSDVAHTAILYNSNSLSEERITFQFLVGCDGGRSLTRKLAKIPFGGETINTSLLVLDGEIETDIPGKNFLNLFFRDESCLLMIRISETLVRFMIPIEGSTHTFNDDMFFGIVDRVLPPFKYKIKTILRKNAFALNERRAQSHFKGNIYLCGDSAHVHSPAGGQGLNTGFQDAYNLAWKLALMVKGVGSQDVLSKSFDEERGLVAEQVLESSGQLLRFTLSKPSFYTFLSRNIIIPFALSLPQIQQQAAALLSEVHITYPENPLNNSTNYGGFFGGIYPGIGKRIPDFPLYNPVFNTSSSSHQVLKGGYCFELLLHIPKEFLSIAYIYHLADLLSEIDSNQLNILKNRTTDPLFQLNLIIQSDMFQPHQWTNFMKSQNNVDFEQVDKIHKFFFSLPIFLDQTGNLKNFYNLPKLQISIVILRPDSHTGLIQCVDKDNVKQVIFGYFNNFIVN